MRKYLDLTTWACELAEPATLFFRGGIVTYKIIITANTKILTVTFIVRYAFMKQFYFLI